MADPDTRIKAEPEEDLSDLSDLESSEPSEPSEDWEDEEDYIFSENKNTPPIELPALQLSTNLDKMLWHQCGTDSKLTLRQKVTIKEAAIQLSISRLEGLIPALKAVQKKLPTGPHVETISRLITNYRAKVVLIGLMGSTGAGKSSMINALLGVKDLLPADDGAAVTASVIKILYNDVEDPAQSLRAEIEFATEEELVSELKLFRVDLDDEDKEDENADPDSEREERIKCNLQWVHNIWPHIKTKHAFQKLTTHQLIADPKLQTYLGQVKKFETSNFELFTKWIRPYIAATDDSAGALWPIVKVVRIYTKSPILKEGICLVDIPGVCDTNTARGAIADRIQRELAITLVVADALRAESNRPAQELLGSVRQRTMQLNNQFSSDRLAFVISKCDNQLTVDRYITNHLTSDSQVMDDRKAKKTAEALKIVADTVFKKKRDEAIQLRFRLGDFERTLEQLEGPPSVSKKRKFEDDNQNEVQSSQIKKLIQVIKDTDHAGLEMRSEVLALQEKVTEFSDYINHCQSRMTKTCIVHRHEQSAEAIKKDYDLATARLKSAKSSKPLKVFSISANAFFERLEGGNPLGFPTNADTGIPRLQEWLIKSTLKDRKEHSDRFLNEIVALEKSLDLSLASSSMGHKMPESESQEIWKGFEKQRADLLHLLSTANNEAAAKIQKLVVNGLFNKFAATEKIAVKNLMEAVKLNGQKIHWSVFRTTNKRMGKYTCIKGKDTATHDFNANMAGVYFDPLMKIWTSTIHEKVPASRTIYETATEKHLMTFVEDITCMAKQNCPALALQIAAWGDSAKGTIEIIRKNALDVFNITIKEWVKDTHPLMAISIQKLWEETYESCGAETGKGHFKRSKAAHLVHATGVAVQMFKRGSKAMRQHLRILFGKLATEFDKGTLAAIRQVEREFKVLLENHTLYGDEESDKSRFHSEKDHLRAITNSVFKAIGEDWKIEVEFPLPEKEEMKEMSMPTWDGEGGSKKDMN